MSLARFTQHGSRRIAKNQPCFSWLAASSPVWMAACAPTFPPLEFDGLTKPVGLLPTRAAVRLEVSTPSVSFGCSNSFKALSILEASCGDDCAVRLLGPGGDWNSVGIEITASTPGVKALELVLDDPEVGQRWVTTEVEFADVARLETTHDARVDPGAALPMLTWMEAEWCVHAFAADERPIELFRTPLALESKNEVMAVGDPIDQASGKCWPLGAMVPGTGRVELRAAGLSIEHSPQVVSEWDIAEIHLHRAQLPHELRLPLEQAGEPNAEEISSIVLGDGALPFGVVVRLLTKDGRMARGGGQWFYVDDPFAVLDSSYFEGHAFALSFNGGLPIAACLRAAIGDARLAIPVYAYGGPDETADPCLEPPPVYYGEGGAGGAGGEGGLGGGEP